MNRVLLHLLLLVVWGPLVHAHELRPGYLELRETDTDVYDVLWKVPGQGENLRLALYVELPADCTNVAAPRATMAGNAYSERWSVRRPGGLTGGMIHVAGLSATLTDVLVRLERLDGAVQVTRLTASVPSWVVAAVPGGWEVARTYGLLGIEHILGGVDHLLFVLALLLVVRGPASTGSGRAGDAMGDKERKGSGAKGFLGDHPGVLVKTITAFTVAHSITLALATLGFMRVPSAPVEAVIALSIMFVASEVLHARAGRVGLTARSPWVVAFTFGLLHGFGFAGALTEVGLPGNAVPLALLFFNVGVEAGQLLFVAMILAGGTVLARIRSEWPVWAESLPPYAIGGCAAFWVIQRMAVILS